MLCAWLDKNREETNGDLNSRTRAPDSFVAVFGPQKMNSYPRPDGFGNHQSVSRENKCSSPRTSGLRVYVVRTFSYEVMVEAEQQRAEHR